MLLGYALNTYHTRKDRQDFRVFASLVASPGNLATGVQLPASATLAISTTSVLSSTTALVTVDGVSLHAPAGTTNRQNVIGRFGKNSTVTKAAGAPGTVRLFVRDPAGVLRLIAQG